MIELAQNSSGVTSAAAWPMVAERAATSDEARNALTRLDEREPEEIERHRDRAREAD